RTHADRTPDRTHDDENGADDDGTADHHDRPDDRAGHDHGADDDGSADHHDRPDDRAHDDRPGGDAALTRARRSAVVAVRSSPAAAAEARRWEGEAPRS